MNLYWHGLMRRTLFQSVNHTDEVPQRWFQANVVKAVHTVHSCILNASAIKYEDETKKVI